MERFGRVIAFKAHRNHIKSGSSTTYSSPNLELAINDVTWFRFDENITTLEDITFPKYSTDAKEPSSGVITMPSSLQSIYLNPGDRVLVSLMLLKSLNNYMPSNATKFIPSQTIRHQRSCSGNVPAAVMVSASFVVAPIDEPFNREYSSQTLLDSVYINYTFQRGLIENEATCAFWQFSNNSSPGQWINTGLTTVKLNANKIMCVSTHLTSFSVLMAIDSDDDVLSYITYIGCGISLACLLPTLICLIYCRSYLLYERNFINVNFVIALMLALIFFLAGIDQSNNRRLCKAMTMIMHYLFLSVFCWMLCEGLLLYRLVIRVFHSGKKYSKTYFAIGWGLPAIVVAVSVGLRYDEYGAYKYCFLTSDRQLIYAFIGPMGAILLINLIVFVMVLKKVTCGRDNYSVSSSSNPNAIRSSVRAMTVLLPMLGLTWIFGVLAIDTLSFVMACIFTVLNSLQGLFVFLFHCLFSEQVRKALRETRNRTRRRRAVERIPRSSKTSNALQSTSSENGQTSGLSYQLVSFFGCLDHCCCHVICKHACLHATNNYINLI
jgi:hypothetical protein